MSFTLGLIMVTSITYIVVARRTGAVSIPSTSPLVGPQKFLDQEEHLRRALAEERLSSSRDDSLRF